ncbi:shikimate dehydrogenase [Planococcus sp. YIM B11945]|uniref:shikimate dehydrogenase n=1 Tax=Planococcus sp. YIM B11945 TaxID=3435410 RepID=UPI003D7DEAE7
MKKWYAVMGDPIAHSLSPFMHETWFREHGLDAAYIPLHVEPQKLGQAFEGLKILGVSGFNVTLPHKQAILPLLDTIDETAKAMNAVNTVVFDGKQFTGFNTDGDGFVQSLLVHPVDKQSRVLLIGAGGAARGIAHALKRAGFSSVVIANRTQAKAEELAAEISGQALTLEEAETALGEFGAIIQTTSVGLDKNQALPISLTHLNPSSLAADIIYNPITTPFLQEAEKKGCTTLNGVGMFVYQGAIAFEKWTGIKPDSQKMISIITDKLGGHYVNQ